MPWAIGHHADATRSEALRPAARARVLQTVLRERPWVWFGSMGIKLLIATGEAAPDPTALPTGVRALVDSADEVLVVAPALPGRLDWIASDTDKAREQADERLGAVLGHLDEIGADAEGAIGSDDPIEAFGDAMRSFSADHILVLMRSGDRAGWQERGLVDELVERFSVPVTVFQL